MPHIRFLSIGWGLCSTLLSDLASRRCPGASLSLLRHQNAKGTCTPELLNMPGTQAKGSRHSLASPDPIVVMRELLKSGRMASRSTRLHLPPGNSQVIQVHGGVPARAEPINLELGVDHRAPPQVKCSIHRGIQRGLGSIQPYRVVSDPAGIVPRIIGLDVVPCVGAPRARVAMRS